MKFTKLKIATFFAICSAGLVSEANATPFTFDFTSPAWTYNFAPAEFGTAINLSITVDNGGASSASQAFRFSEITSIGVSAIGGTWTDTFTSGFTTIDGTMDAITTDASSLASLALSIPNGNGVGRIWMELGDIQFQIGQITPSSGGYTPLLVTDTSNYLQAVLQEGTILMGALQGGSGAKNPPPPTTGGGSNNIPEPSSIALLGLGLMGFALARQKI